MLSYRLSKTDSEETSLSVDKLMNALNIRIYVPCVCAVCMYECPPYGVCLEYMSVISDIDR